MNKKNVKNPEYTEEQMLFAASLWTSSAFYSDFLRECGVSEDYKNWPVIRSILKTEFRNRVVFAVWASLSEDHRERFEDFKKANSHLDTESAAMRYVLLDEALRGRVFEALEQFLESFKERYFQLYGKGAAS